MKYGKCPARKMLHIVIARDTSLPVGREVGWMEGKIKFHNFMDVPLTSLLCDPVCFEIL